MKKNSFPTKPFLIPLALFIFSFLLRFFLISKGPYHSDCLHLAQQAEKTLSTGQLQTFLWPGYNLTLILGVLTLWISQIFGCTDPVRAVNLMSVIFGAASIPAFFMFVRKILNEQTAFYSSILLSAFPLALSISTFGSSHTPSLFFLFLGLTALTAYKTTKPGMLFVSGLCLGLMGACRPQDLALMFLPISYFYFILTNKPSPEPSLGKKKKMFWFILFWFSAGLVILLFQAPVLLKHKLDCYQSFISGFDRTVLKAGPLFNRAIIYQKVPSLAIQELSPGLLLAALGGYLLLWQKERRLLFFLILWFSCPFLFYSSIQTTTSRYFLIFLLPLICGAGFALSFLNKKTTFRYLSLLILLLLNIYFLAKIIPVLKFRHQNATTPRLAAWIGSVTDPAAQIITADEGLFIEHYAKRKIINWPVDPYRTGPQDFSVFQNRIDDRLQNNQPTYILLFPDYHLKANQDFIKFLRRNYQLKFIGDSLFEDWHHSTTNIRILPLGLFYFQSKITTRTSELRHPRGP